MAWLNDKVTTMSQGARIATGAALLAIGIAGGASAASLTRPAIEMAPTTITPIAKLSAASGIVTIKGRVGEVFGDRALLTDASGRAMVDIGRENVANLTLGSTITVQGRYDDGQLHGSFLIDPNGRAEAIGPGPRGPGGPGAPGPHGPGPHDPRGGPPAPDCAAPPPPPPAPGVAPAPGAVPAPAPAAAPAPAPAPAPSPTAR